MTTRLEKFKQEMENSKKIYTQELETFAKKYDFLGEVTLREEPDIDTQDYIFCFEKTNGTSEETLDKTLKELYDHMDEFSKKNRASINFAEMQVFGYEGENMNIIKYPQFQLYLLTLNMQQLKKQLIPENCDEWCVNASIINRAYYSAYLYCELWLEDVKNFKIKHPWDFEDYEERIGEHKQVRDALKNFGKKI